MINSISDHGQFLKLGFNCSTHTVYKVSLFSSTDMYIVGTQVTSDLFYVMTEHDFHHKLKPTNISTYVPWCTYTAVMKSKKKKKGRTIPDLVNHLY